jgi:hypothetical protein
MAWDLVKHGDKFTLLCLTCLDRKKIRKPHRTSVRAAVPACLCVDGLFDNAIPNDMLRYVDFNEKIIKYGEL